MGRNYHQVRAYLFRYSTLLIRALFLPRAGMGTATQILLEILRAYLYFGTKVGQVYIFRNTPLTSGTDGFCSGPNNDATQITRRTLAVLLDRPWAGLPELTNKMPNTAKIPVTTQAWNASTLFDLLEDVHKLS